VQFDERADATQPLRVGAERVGVGAGPAHRVGERDTVAVGQVAGRRRVDGAGEQPGAEAGHPEPGTLLLGEDGHPDRSTGAYPALAQHVDREQPGDHAERSVVRAAVRHRVEMAAGDDAFAARRSAPPGDDVAVAVGVHFQLPVERLLDEPLPAVVVGRRPRTAQVAAVTADPPDRK
jgi:hypothetical protein